MKPSVTSLAEADPELFSDVPNNLRLRTARNLLVRTKALARGPWRGPQTLTPHGLGFLILSGLLLCELDLFNAQAIELLGAGDLLGPLDIGPASVRRVASWRVLLPTQVAVLGDDATTQLACLPGVMPALMRRAIGRSRAIETRLALTRIHPLSTRLHVLFWNLADRWGRRVDGSVQLSIPLSHQLLADLASARRPKVTAALGSLADKGLVNREGPGGCWIVSGPPPEAPEPISQLLRHSSDSHRTGNNDQALGGALEPSLPATPTALVP
jgi:CRP-like cAMP-binding protein